MGREDLSLCIIVKNEERTLARCLDSVSGLAPEIIVVDTGSTDRTPAIAAGYGAKVIPFDFAFVDFAAARNHALARANGRWILVLDADEILQPASLPLVQELIAGGENAGYYLQRLNHHATAQRPTSDYVIRLFPNQPSYRYRGRVHETIDDSIRAAGGRLLRTEIRLDHDFASDPQARRRRNLWYIAILNEEIAADPADCSRLVFLAAEYHQLGMFRKAAEVAERIAVMRPHDPQAHLHAGAYHLLYTLERDRARADFAEALRLRPGYVEAQAFLARMENEERASAAHGPRDPVRAVQPYRSPPA
jgi:glycosyltransferase involved in cell wall biosynthesis